MYEALLEETLTKGEVAVSAETVDATEVHSCIRQATQLLRTIDLGIPFDRPFDAPHGRGWLAKQRSRLEALKVRSAALPAPITAAPGSQSSSAAGATNQRQPPTRQTLFAGGAKPVGHQTSAAAQQERNLRMNDTRKELTEMLDVGTSILDNLNSQGATIARNKERVAQVDGQLSSGEQLLKKMQQWWRR
jgi:hypothetical protein